VIPVRIFRGLQFLLAMVLLGCAGSTVPSTPQLDSLQEIANPSESSFVETSHQLWSYQLVHVDLSGLAGARSEIIPLRQVSSHFNVLSWLEQSPCGNCVKITKIQPSGNGTLLVDVELQHPFINLNLTGFDVRGIVMFNASHSFPESGLTISDRSLGDGELVNADGYTSLYNPTTIGHGFEGYLKGKLSTTQVPDATLNGYKRHISPNIGNSRNYFLAGDKVTATYEIDMPDGPFVFGYAVDASWAPPIHKPVQNPIIDFELPGSLADIGFPGAGWRRAHRLRRLGETQDRCLRLAG
jgi:hypothetical protein